MRGLSAILAPTEGPNFVADALGWRTHFCRHRWELGHENRWGECVLEWKRSPCPIGIIGSTPSAYPCRYQAWPKLKPREAGKRVWVPKKVQS